MHNFNETRNDNDDVGRDDDGATLRGTPSSCQEGEKAAAIKQRSEKPRSFSSFTYDEVECSSAPAEKTDGGSVRRFCTVRGKCIVGHEVC